MKKSGARGIKKIAEVNGQSILFEPSMKWRKYVKQYVLSERSGKKQLTCKIHADIAYLSYDVVLFNNRDEVFNVLTVKEKIEKAGYTKTVDLPEETSYVAISVNEVDATDFSAPITAKLENGKFAKFIFWCSLCIFMETFIVKVCCANIFGGVFREMFVFNWETTGVTLMIAVALIIINWIITSTAVKIRSGKTTSWNK